MPLTSSDRKYPSSSFTEEWIKDVYYNTPDRIRTSEAFGRFSRYESFVVSPSPCRNIGNFKHPTPYGYTKIVRVLPHGEIIYTGHTAGQLTYKAVVRGSHSTDVYGSTGTSLGTLSYTLPTMSTDARTKAMSKFYEKIRSSEVSLNTSVGEARESLQMMASIARSARRVISDLRKIAIDAVINRPRGKRLLKKLTKKSIKDPHLTVSGLWLGWSVGLKPLINDCENIRNHALKGLGEGAEFHVKARASHQRDSYVTIPGGIETYKVDERVEYGALIRILDTHMFENWRAGLTARPTLLWELTTLSFVVDYFINIGQWLELYEASLLNNGFQLVGGTGYCTTVTKESRTKEFSKSYTPSSPVDLTYARLAMSEDKTRKSRTLISQLPTPGAPVVKIPRAAEPLLNCAALLSGLIGRK